jgi:hypothetical protein
MLCRPRLECPDDLLRRIFAGIPSRRDAGEGQGGQLRRVLFATVGDLINQVEKTGQVVAKRAGGMHLTERGIHETIRRDSGFGTFFERTEEVNWLAQQEKRILERRIQCCSGKIERVWRGHMASIEGKGTFFLSALLYLLFNLRIGADTMATVKASLWQIAQTAPYVAGLTYVIIALLQYMGGGQKLPWDRRLRLFFAIGIVAGLVYGIYEYAGTSPQ